MNFANSVNKAKGVKFNAHKYQLDAVKWVVSNNCSGLFLPPGLGKTAVMLQSFVYLKKAGIIDKMVVIAPIRVMQLVWPEEIKKWANFNHITCTVLHGAKKDDRLYDDVDLYIVNPDGLKWFTKKVKDLTSEGKWMLTVDESSNFKNGRSGRFKMLKKWVKYFDRRVILTGTPAPNGFENLWSQIHILDSGTRLGKFITSYRNMFFFPSGYMGYEYRLQDGAKEKIYGKIDDIIMHKGREEIDMPDLIKNVINVELPSQARKIYSDMSIQFLAVAEDEQLMLATTAAVMSGKLKQIANGASYGEDKVASVIHESKIDAVKELHEGMEGQPLLIFYEYRHDLSRLQDAFSDAPHLGGGVSAKEAEVTVKKWNSGEVPILFLHPASAGHGLNLQSGGCHDVCWFSITWDQELHEQAISRVWRQGVEYAVTSHYIVAKDTIDEQIMEVLDGKEKLQSALLNALKK